MRTLRSMAILSALILLAPIFAHAQDDPSAAQRQVYTYPVKNGIAQNVEAVANLLFKAGGAALGRVGGITQPFDDLAGEVSIVSDARANSLLVVTSPENWPRVKAILDQLDALPLKVLIKALVAEVPYSAVAQMGAEVNELTELGNPSIVRGRPGEKLGGVIQELETSDRLHEIARPYVQAVDNQLTQLRISHGTAEFIAAPPTTQRAPDLDADLILDIIPHVAPGGSLIIEMAPGSRFLPPEIRKSMFNPFASRAADFRVALESGQTIILIGPVIDHVSDSMRRIRPEADSDMLRQLFKWRQSSRLSVIFLTYSVSVPQEN